MNVAGKLKYARKTSKLTGAQVRERTGVGESSLSDFENGKREPSLSQLQALAKAYRRSLSFFLSEGPILHERILWRQRPTLGAEAVETLFLQLIDQYHNLELWTDDNPPLHLPELQERPDSFGYENAQELAKHVRLVLQLGERPAPVLLRVLEEVCGVKVFHLNFEPKGTAASLMSETFGAAILLNSGNARWRRNHDVAHELFHLLTWRIFRNADDSTVPIIEANDQEEKWATCFARNLLMPPEATRTAINSRLKDGKLTYEALFNIAREFDVSVESLLWHMHFLYRRGVAAANQTERTIEHAKSLARLLKERIEEATPPVWPARYYALAVKALRNGEISVGRFADYLGISRQQAMKYVEQELSTDANEEIQLAPA